MGAPSGAPAMAFTSRTRVCRQAASWSTDLGTTWSEGWTKGPRQPARAKRRVSGPPSEPSSFQDEVAEVANKLAQVSLHDQEYLVVEAETLDTRAADREEVTRVLEEENCELASDLDWSADEEDLAVAQAEPGEPDLDEPMGEAFRARSRIRRRNRRGSFGPTYCGLPPDRGQRRRGSYSRLGTDLQLASQPPRLELFVRPRLRLARNGPPGPGSYTSRAERGSGCPARYGGPGSQL